VISDRLSVSLPVVEAIGPEAKSKFTGRIHKATIDVKEMKNEIKITSLRFEDSDL